MAGFPWVAGDKALAADTNKLAGTALRITPPVSLASGTADYQALGNLFSNNNTSPLFHAYSGGSTTVTIKKYEQDETGLLTYGGVTATITAASSGTNVTVLGITCDATNVYVIFRCTVVGVETLEVHRLSQSTLGSDTSVTGIGAATASWRSGACFYWDPTTSKFWFLYNANTVKGYTISGTALTNTDTITLSVSLSTTGCMFYKKANGSFVVLDNTIDNSYEQTLKVYGSTGTQTSSVTRSVVNKAGITGDYPLGVINLYGNPFIGITKANSTTSYEILFKPFAY
jgi:hypothetical protein